MDFLKYLVPGAPTNFSAVAINSTTIYLSWSAPVTTNGILLNYTIISFENGSYLEEFAVGNNTLEVLYYDLEEDTEYSILVYANTSAGRGDSSIANARTFEDCKQYLLHIDVYIIIFESRNCIHVSSFRMNVIQILISTYTVYLCVCSYSVLLCYVWI